MNTTESVSRPTPLPGHAGVFIRPRRPAAHLTEEVKLRALFQTDLETANPPAPAPVDDELRSLLEEARNWLSYWNAGPNPALLARLEEALKRLT